MSGEDRFYAAIMGAINGALTEALYEACRRLRRQSAEEFEIHLKELERLTRLRIDNLPLDGLPEEQQLFIVEKTADHLRAVFATIRNEAHG